MSTGLSFPEREANAVGDLDGVEDNADKYSPPNEPPSFACACRPVPGRSR
jgi:hypothetical protein